MTVPLQVDYLKKTQVSLLNLGLRRVLHLAEIFMFSLLTVKIVMKSSYDGTQLCFALK